MTDLVNSECVLIGGVMLCALPAFCLLYAVDCFVNEERFSCNHVIIWLCFQLFCVFSGFGKNLQFWEFMFSQVVQRLVRWGGKINYHLIAYSLYHISAKNYQNQLTYVEARASDISVVFWRHTSKYTSAIRLLAVYFVVEWCFLRYVWFSFYSNKPTRDWLGKTSLKWPILCRVGRKNLNSVNQVCDFDRWVSCSVMWYHMWLQFFYDRTHWSVLYMAVLSSAVWCK